MISSFTERFETSEQLFEFLKSNEGGRLNIREETLSPENPFVLIHYDKTKSDMSLPHVGRFRSVVWNARTNRPVCIAPAQSSTLTDTFTLSEDATIEEFVDGVMINMFWDGTRWRLATRTQLDAPGHFYGKRPFAELFTETFLGAGFNFNDFNRDLCYSWVLQHPSERVVVPIPYGVAKLYLVETTNVASGLPVPPPAGVRTPEKHLLTSMDAVKARMLAWGHRFGIAWQGLVIKQGGRRFKLRSAQYEAARELRGNQAKLPYVWMERWSQGRLISYLRQYPEEAPEAEALTHQFKTCTQELHHFYLEVYRNHTMPLRDVPQKYRKLLWEAHQANAGAYFPHLRNFMNVQDPARKLWLVNYETRYGPVDTVIATPVDTVIG